MAPTACCLQGAGPPSASLYGEALSWVVEFVANLRLTVGAIADAHKPPRTCAHVAGLVGGLLLCTVVAVIEVRVCQGLAAATITCRAQKQVRDDSITTRTCTTMPCT